jgi:hypothetical protein
VLGDIGQLNGVGNTVTYVVGEAPEPWPHQLSTGQANS